MLIVSMPKSSSTGTWSSVAHCSGLFRGHKEDHKTYKHRVGEFTELSKMWSNAGTYHDEHLIKMAADTKNIYRAHVLPLEENLDQLRRANTPLVVLVRKPEDILKAFDRMYGKKNFYAKNAKMLDELRYSYGVYTTSPLNGKVMLVHFEKHVLKWEKSIARIVEHFGLEQVEKATNSKRDRYTGVGLKELLEKQNGR